jgi:hypothetical protein
VSDSTAHNERASLDLHKAALAGDLAAARAALAAGADVHYNSGVALRAAAETEHFQVLSFLVRDAGADVHVLQDKALRLAVKNGNDATVDALLSLGADPNAMDGEPLVEAAKRGRAGIAKSLLARRANPHFSNDHALRLAALNGHEGIVRDLVRAKADVFAMGASAENLAAAEGHAAIAGFLRARMEEERRLFLLELGLPVDARQFLLRDYRDTGEPGLIRAVRMDCLTEAVRRLAETGGGLSPQDLAGVRDREHRPLWLVAAEHGRLKPLFALDLWRAREEAVQAWNAIPGDLRRAGGMSEDDFAGLVAGFDRRALKEKSARKSDNFKLKPRGL